MSPAPIPFATHKRWDLNPASLQRDPSLWPSSVEARRFPLHIAITGASGRLGRRLLPLLARAGHAITPISRADVNITNPSALLPALDPAPDALLLLSGLASLDRCERDPTAAWTANVATAAAGAAVAAMLRIPVLYASTDYVFHQAPGPEGGWPRSYWKPSDRPCPRSVYGATKVEGERAILASPALRVQRNAIEQDGKIYTALAYAGVIRLSFADPEDLLRRGEGSWINATTRGSREWVGEAAERVAAYIPGWFQKARLATIGGCMPPPPIVHLVHPSADRTLYEMARLRYPNHPALSDPVHPADPRSLKPSLLGLPESLPDLPRNVRLGHAPIVLPTDRRWRAG
jgi:hypothetical protein